MTNTAAAPATCSGPQRKHNFSRAAAQANTPTRGDPTPARIRAARSPTGTIHPRQIPSPNSKSESPPQKKIFSKFPPIRPNGL